MAGLELSEIASEQIVLEFRQSHPKIVELWRRLQDACASCDGRHYRFPLPCTQHDPAWKRYLIYRDVATDREGITATVAGERVRVYGGLLAENWTQATARDILPCLFCPEELVCVGPDARSAIIRPLTSSERRLRRREAATAGGQHGRPGPGRKAAENRRRTTATARLGPTPVGVGSLLWTPGVQQATRQPRTHA